MNDLPIISLDIETYGACSQNSDGKPLPRQRTFHPQRSIHLDKCPVKDLVQTCSITIATSANKNLAQMSKELSSVPASDVRWLELTSQILPYLQTQETMVLQLHRTHDRKVLIEWLKHARLILGMNLQFDLAYLHALPWCRPYIDGRHLLVDLSILRFLENDNATDRSLKAIGPVLNLYKYKDSRLREGERYYGPYDPELHLYNAADTENTLCAISTLARRILTQRDESCVSSLDCSVPSSSLAGSSELFSRDHRLTPDSLSFFSHLIYSCIEMSRNGQPFSRPSLERLEAHLLKTSARCTQELEERFNLKISGAGSVKARVEILQKAFDWIDASVDLEPLIGVKSIYNHSLFSYTDKTREIARDSTNRNLALAFLPPDSEFRQILSLWEEAESSQKQVSTFTYPLLRHRRKNEDNVASTMVPYNHHISLSHNGWFLTPSASDSGDSGGQRQARIASANPNAQQFDPDIRLCLASRYGLGGRIVECDLSQIELRVAALFSGDSSLVSAYLEGTDLHTGRAISVFGPSVTAEPSFGSGDRRSDQRQWAKTFNFADLYLASARVMQETFLRNAGVIKPLSFFQEVERSRPTVRPGLTAWQARILHTARKHGVIRIPVTGHYRTFIDGNAANKPNEIVNFPIQSTAALTLQMLQVWIYQRLNPLIKMFFNHYDALYFDCPVHLLQELRDLYDQAIKTISTNGFWSMLCDFHSRHIPLEYSFSVKAPHSLWRPT